MFADGKETCVNDNCFFAWNLSELTFLSQQFILHHGFVVFDGLGVSRTVEENQERQTFLGELLGILESDFTDQRNAFPQHPLVHLFDVRVTSLISFVVVVGKRRVGSENDDGVTGRVHLGDDIAEANVELTIFFKICGDAAENVVLGLVATVEVTDDDALLVVERVEVFDRCEFLCGVFKLLFGESEVEKEENL